ncbi:hypothetical protein TcCL_Unassigned03887 [Trypanosoma cruzi]|nr:hypothetical protein TcCL_Unassigned03887 [Trypanosoma cruzi]
MGMIITPNNAKHQSGATCGPQTPTRPPIHSSSSQWRGPPAPLRNTPVPQLCVPLTQALKMSFGNPAFNTYEKREDRLAETTRLLNVPSNPPHDSLMRWRGIQAALVSQRAANGSAVHMKKTPRIKTEGWEKNSQRPSPATPDMRRLIFATVNQ